MTRLENNVNLCNDQLQSYWLNYEVCLSLYQSNICWTLHDDHNCHWALTVHTSFDDCACIFSRSQRCRKGQTESGIFLLTYGPIELKFWCTKCFLKLLYAFTGDNISSVQPAVKSCNIGFLLETLLRWFFDILYDNIITSYTFIRVLMTWPTLKVTLGTRCLKSPNKNCIFF